MEGIFNILKSEGLEIDESTQKRISTKLSAEYKTIAEYTNIKKKLDDSRKKILEYENINLELDELRSKHEEISKLYEDSKGYKYKLQAFKSGINEKFIDFVTSEVSKKVNDKTDFTTALEQYNKENPQFLNNCPVVSISTTPNVSNSTSNITSNDLINNFIRGD